MDSLAEEDWPQLLEEVETRTHALFTLLRAMPHVEAAAIDAMETTERELRRRREGGDCVILVLGEGAARRRTFDLLFGAPVLTRAKAPLRAATIRVRIADEFDYVATFRSGPSQRFARRVQDRDGTFAKGLARAQRDRDAAVTDVSRIEQEITAARRKLDEARAPSIPIVLDEIHLLPPEQSPPAVAPSSLLGRIWHTVVAWLGSVFGSRPALPAPPEAPPQTLVEQAHELPSVRPPALSLDDASENPTRVHPSKMAELGAARQEALSRIARAEEHAAQLEEERERYTVERRAAFFQDLRVLVDEAASGAQLVSLAVEIPAVELRRGIVLVDAPDVDAEIDADACLHLTDGGPALMASGLPRPPTGEAVPVPVHALSSTPSAEQLGRALDRIAHEAPLIAGARAIAIARGAIANAVETASKIEGSIEGRIAALQGQLLKDPVEFRARSLARVEQTIVDAAGEIENAALERLGKNLGAVRAEWLSSVAGRETRAALEATMRSIDRTAQERITAAIDDTNALVITEIQRETDTIQLWFLEEIHARYHVARRFSTSNEAAPVIADAVADEHALRKESPLAGAAASFERERVGYGIGGAAAGAIIGTLIAPVIGTAIGAFVGVFAGFLKGTGSLREECLHKLDANLDRVERELRSELSSRRVMFESAIRTFLEETLDAAMLRFERLIARLIELEHRTLANEQDKRTRFVDLRAMLEAHEDRLAELAERLVPTRSQTLPAGGASVRKQLPSHAS